MKIDLSYQTQALPAPFAFATTITLEANSNEVNVQFGLEYLGRDELSVGEILAEGYSENDDFQWKGKLGGNWRNVMTWFSNLSYKSEPSTASYLHVLIDDQERGFPTEDQELLIQELIQAVFEAGKKETPLCIELINENNDRFVLSWSFAFRTFSIDDQEFDWAKGILIMERIYSMDLANAPLLKKSQPFTIKFLGKGKWVKLQKSEALRIFQLL